MQASEVASMKVVAFCRYDAVGVELLLMVERSTFIPGKGVTVDGVTLSSSAAPTLGAVVLGGRVGLMMAHRLQLAVLRLAALMLVVGMVHNNVQKTFHTMRTMRSAVAIVGIAQWLG